MGGGGAVAVKKCTEASSAFRARRQRQILAHSLSIIDSMINAASKNPGSDTASELRGQNENTAQEMAREKKKKGCCRRKLTHTHSTSRRQRCNNGESKSVSVCHKSRREKGSAAKRYNKAGSGERKKKGGVEKGWGATCTRPRRARGEARVLRRVLCPPPRRARQRARVTGALPPSNSAQTMNGRSRKRAKYKHWPHQTGECGATFAFLG